MTNVTINGAAGRMGCRLIALGSADESINIVGAVEQNGFQQMGSDAGPLAGIGDIGVPVSTEIDDRTQVVIDFSTPAGAESAINACLEKGLPLILATTGLSESQKQLATSAGEKIPMVWAPSMSLSVNIAMKLTETAASALKDCPGGADVEIIEKHHRFKEDSPSGTALRFGEIVADVMGQSNHQHGREGFSGARPHDEIGYHAVRVGDNPGEHTIIFGLLGETLELRVSASNRDCYASGALLAARWIADKQPGIYGMFDVLGI